MCIKLKCSLLLLLCVGMFSVTKAQQKKIDNDMAKFFVGNWSGEGQFANGKKIAADASFSLSVDSSCLIYAHADKPPNVYKATSAWGIDRLTGKFATHIINNFNGHTEFTSESWKNGRIIFTNSANIAARGIFYQHFIYEKINEDQFKMTYEVSKDGISWKEGDHLIFTRTDKN